MRHEGRLSIRTAAEQEGVEDRRAEGIHVTRWAMRPPALAGEKIQQTVAVEISERHRVWLGELHVRDLFVAFHGGDGVRRKGNRAVRAALLLEPTDTIAVGVDCGDDVAEFVAIH